MKERPILMNGEMVRAILDGRKTQTRRPIKPQPTQLLGGFSRFQFNDGKPFPDVMVNDASNAGAWRVTKRCPYGQPGDRLWVRETWALVPRTAYAMSDGVQQMLRPDDDHDAAVYRAGWTRSEPQWWRPSIHMPRWASRILLEITDVRVQRVQEISLVDVKAEGCEPNLVELLMLDIGRTELNVAQAAFSRVWDSLYANRGYGWDSNCWVWVIGFRRL